jgi:hypothetical protein
MKIGCTAHDTIQEVHSTSLKESDSISSCVVELHWQNKESIDLLFVLSICFAIHNGKWADRYTLQRYNCYFLSWAIIAITMRKSAVCRAVFNAGKVQGGVRELERGLKQALERGLGQMLEQVLEAERKARGLVQGAKRARELALELAEELALELAEELARELAEELAGELARELAGELLAELLVGELAEELVGELLAGELGRELRRGLELELLQLGWERELLRQREQALVRERVREWAREWARGLGQIPLLLGSRKNSALAKAVSSRQVVFVILLLYGLIYSNIAQRA